MRLSKIIICGALLATVTDFGAKAASADSSAPIVAPKEYDWTFFYKGMSYGLEQYGPVSIYPRNTHLIWRSRAHRIPVTVPGVVVIALCGVSMIGYFGVMMGRRRSASASRSELKPG